MNALLPTPRHGASPQVQPAKLNVRPFTGLGAARQSQFLDWAAHFPGHESGHHERGGYDLQAFIAEHNSAARKHVGLLSTLVFSHPDQPDSFAATVTVCAIAQDGESEVIGFAHPPIECPHKVLLWGYALAHPYKTDVVRAGIRAALEDHVNRWADAQLYMAALPTTGEEMALTHLGFRHEAPRANLPDGELDVPHMGRRVPLWSRTFSFDTHGTLILEAN